MSDLLTHKAIFEYNKNPDHCPYCNANGEYIHYTPFDVDGLTIWRLVTCFKCDKEWHEIYKFESIEEITDD